MVLVDSLIRVWRPVSWAISLRVAGSGTGVGLFLFPDIMLSDILLLQCLVIHRPSSARSSRSLVAGTRLLRPIGRLFDGVTTAGFRRKLPDETLAREALKTQVLLCRPDRLFVPVDI